jgi:putative Ca2+/H+ antiporter (TMEM165/GDT1 family)
VEPLLIAFAAALLGGWADKTQCVAADLSARTGKPGTVAVALLIVVLANSVVAAVAGTLLRLEVSLHAAALLLAVALAFAGVAGLIGEAPKRPKERGGAFFTALLALAGAGWGDKTQYVIAALAAYYADAPLIAGGAFAGSVAVSLPAALAGAAFARSAPVKPLRIVFAAVFLIAAVIVTLNTLRLV